MRYGTLLLVFLALGGPTTAAAQEAEARPKVAHREFRISLEPLVAPGYAPARELRVALFDSPVSRLELAAWREQWSARNPGPVGPVMPLHGVYAPFRLRWQNDPRNALILPGTARWRELGWEDQLASGAELGLLTWALVEVVRHAR